MARVEEFPVRKSPSSTKNTLFLLPPAPHRERNTYIRCFAMSTSPGISSCQTCGQETNYRCLICEKAKCNRSTNCSVAAPEETQDWKVGSKISFCASCKTEATATEFVRKSNASSSGTELEDQNTSKSVKKSTTTSQTAGRDHSNMKSQKRKFLDLSTKIAVINFGKDHPSFGSRKIAEEFGTGKTQIQTILRNKESIFVLYESNVGQSQQKRSRTGRYSNVNIAL